MKKLWEWLFGTRNQQCNIHVVRVAVCGKGNWDCVHEKDGFCKYDGKCTARKTER